MACKAERSDREESILVGTAICGGGNVHDLGSSSNSGEVDWEMKPPVFSRINFVSLPNSSGKGLGRFECSSNK